MTPRRGKAVEINALWFNALKLLERWLGAVGDEDRAQRHEQHATRAQDSFNRRFWFKDGGYLTMSSTASLEAMIPPAGPIKSSRSRSIIRPFCRRAGNQWSMSCSASC